MNTQSIFGIRYLSFGSGPRPMLVVGSLGDDVMTAEASRQIADSAGGTLRMYGREFPHAVYDEAPDFLEKVREFFA